MKQRKEGKSITNVYLHNKILKFTTLIIASLGLNIVAMNYSQSVHAATLSIPKGYTCSRVLKAHEHRISKKEYNKLVSASIRGMKYSNYHDTSVRDQNLIVTPTRLTKNQNKEISKFALSTINSARKQLHRRKWTYDSRVEKMAKNVARYYYNDNASCWDPNHDYHAINLAAKHAGLRTGGNMYEDEAGLPISDKWNGSTRSMAVLKEQVYFNIKQMLFGGYTGQNYNDRSLYTEYDHASDLLGVGKYQPKTKMFGLAFSDLKHDHSKISVHMINVSKDHVLDYKKFNK